MRKKSLTVPSVEGAKNSELNNSDDYAIAHLKNELISNDTTALSDTQSPSKDTKVSIQQDCETTTTDINIMLTSASIQTEKLSSSPPSSTAGKTHGNAVESLSTTDTTKITTPTTNSPRDDQAINNISTPTDTLPPKQSANGNHNHQTLSKPLSPIVTSLPSPVTDSIHNDLVTSNPMSQMNFSSPNNASEVSMVSPSSSAVTDEPASNNSTTANSEAPPGGGKVKRTKRKPYQTPTAEQLESLVNGHLRDKLSISAAARRAGIARSTASSLMKKHKTQGSIPERQPRGRTAPAKIQAEQAEWIDRYLLDHESATLETIRVALLMAFPNISQISLSGLQRNITLKCTRHLKRRRQSKHSDQS